MQQMTNSTWFGTQCSTFRCRYCAKFEKSVERWRHHSPTEEHRMSLCYVM